MTEEKDYVCKDNERMDDFTIFSYITAVHPYTTNVERIKEETQDLKIRFARPNTLEYIATHIKNCRDCKKNYEMQMKGFDDMLQLAGGPTEKIN